MAEFQEVMRQRNRMCKIMASCQDCALLKNYVYDCKSYMICKPDEVEKIIMNWAAKHPEPTYPTWKEWYESTFPDRDLDGGICPRTFAKHKCSGIECEDCYREHIPAEIAEKLGIKLKEVE